MFKCLNSSFKERKKSKQTKYYYLELQTPAAAIHTLTSPTLFLMKSQVHLLAHHLFAIT